MKAGLLLTGSGALVYLTSHSSFIDDSLIEKFKIKGISKFIVWEVSADEAKKRYGAHFDLVLQDLRETDDLRILDYDGVRAFKMFPFDELKDPYKYETKK